VRFETIPAGETRQINGPYFGVRVLVAGEGAALVVDRIAMPVPAVLPSLESEVDTLIATGPITFVLGERPGEDLARANATPAPPAPAPPAIQEDVVIHPAGTLVPDMQQQNFLATEFARPKWAKGASLATMIATGWNLGGATAPFFLVDGYIEGFGWYPYADPVQVLMVTDHRPDYLAHFSQQASQRSYGVAPSKVRVRLAMNYATANVAGPGLPVFCRWVG
jgi:hypothetical protein